MRRLGQGLLGLVFALVAQGAPITVVNASFEDDVQANFGFTNGVHTGWTSSATNLTGTWRPGLPNTTRFNLLPNGAQLAYVYSGASLSQTVSVLATEGLTYTLEVDLGIRKDYAASLGLGFAELRVGNNIITATGSAPTHGNWSTYTAVYTALAADAGQPISIFLRADPGDLASFDNVRLNDAGSGGNPVPEPAGMAVLGLAGLLAAKRYWRR
jgi:hypothetical protein